MTRLDKASHVVSIVETLRTSLMRVNCMPWVLWALTFAVGWLGVTKPGSP